MLVLNGNNPRFPWEPSTTMLTYRLKALQRERRPTGTDTPSLPREAQIPLSHRDGRGDHIFARPGEHPRCSVTLT